MCTVFELNIKLKKTKVIAQAITSPNITISNYQLKMVDEFIYLASTTSSKLYVDKEIDRRIGRTASTVARLGTRLWKNP